MRDCLFRKGLVVGILVLFISTTFATSINVNITKLSGDRDTEYWALLVAVGVYADHPEQDRPYMLREVENLYDMLLVSEHWNEDHIKVIKGESCSVRNIVNGLRWLDSVDDKDDFSLVFINTHGFPLGYDIPPFDEDDRRDEALVSYWGFKYPWAIIWDDLLNLFLSLLDSKGVCVVIDSCFSGGFNDPPYFRNRMKDYRMNADEWMEEFAEDLSGRGRVVLMSCQEDELSYGSLFIKLLIKSLRGYADTNEDGMCSAEEAFVYIEENNDWSQMPTIFDNYPGELLLTEVKLPNRVPVISDENPVSGTLDVPVTLSELSFRISDPDGDLMDYTVTTDPDIGTGSGNNKKDGVYTVPVSGLEYNKVYRWTVEVDDDKDTIVKEFSFFTEMLPFDPFDEGWQYCKKVTIDHTQVDDDLTNFPVLISNVDVDLRDKAQDDGDDILFMDDIGIANKLCHEIERYDGSSGELVAWVRVPSLSTTVDTVLYMYYGNPSSSSQQIPEKVWDSSYCGVWHLEGFYDSTINDNDGTNYGTDDCSGKIGNAKDFVENDQDYIDLGDMPEPADNHIATGTFEAWINPREGARGSIISKSDNNLEPDRRSYTFYLAPTGKFQFGAGSGTWYPDERIIYAITNDNHVSSGTWQYIVAVADLPSENIILYYNGEEKDSTINILGNPPTFFYDIVLNEWLGVGRAESGLQYYDGYMDEVRISKNNRSAEWISTQYNNQNNPLSFLSFGSEESGP